MVHDFSDRLEREASPVLNEWYRSNFKNLLGIIDVTDNRFYRHIGIDKFLIFKCPDIAKTICISIDEKARRRHYKDILAEIWSKREKEIPGWVWTCKADYIVYAYYVNGDLVEPPLFIPTVDFVTAIKTKDYPRKETKTITETEIWTTIFKPIPREDLPSKPPIQLTLEYFLKVKIPTWREVLEELKRNSLKREKRDENEEAD